MRPLYDVFLCWVELAAGGRVSFPDVSGRNVFLYVVRGSIDIAGAEGPHYHLLEMSDAGDTVDIEAKTDAVLLVGHAEPIGAPVVSYGPFVMNTREEIIQAIRDYEAGKFDAIPAGNAA
jgi:redox-sensitive bicupin YhaK (pirin superfamily)